MKPEAINIHHFDSYSFTDRDYQRATGSIQSFSFFSENHGNNNPRITVFISHKHSDLILGHLSSFLGCLKEDYNVDPYIDSFDQSMPEKTSGKTAERIKDKIIKCKKFILFATNDAINSKWCNWELGFGDSQKFTNNNLAIIPIEETSGAFKGSEYLQIYPYIVYRDYTSIPNYRLKRKLYVKCETNKTFVPLDEWLKR